MNNIKLISDSSCDFTADEIKNLDITIIPFSCTFDDNTYLRENIDITKEEIYEKFNDPSVFAKTSLPSVNTFFEAFEEAVKEGKEVLCFNISSGFSGSYQSAVTAKNMLLEDYPNARIEIIDTKLFSVGQGALIHFAHSLLQKGKSLTETAEIVLKNRARVSMVLTASTLKYLIRGGRIGKMQGLAGELLNIAPIIAMKDGELHNVDKVRGQKKAISSMADYSTNFAKSNNFELENCKAYIFRCTEDVEPLKAKIVESGYNTPEVRQLGVTITVHIGTTVTGICTTCFEE